MTGIQQFVKGEPNADHAHELVSSIDSGHSLLDSDVEVADNTPVYGEQQPRTNRRGLAVALAGGVMLSFCLFQLLHGSQSVSPHSTDDTVSKFASDIDKAQPGWQVVTKERDLCSSGKESCFDSQCCKVAGHKCYLTSNTVAKCMPYCQIGKDSVDCTQLQKQQTFEVESSGPADTMFCFSVYTDNTGSPKPSHEKALLTQQHSQGVSIFACDASAVYSDVSTSLGGGLMTIKVSDVEGDFHFAHRKMTNGKQGPWVNTGMFKQIWKAVGESAKYKDYDWTVKVDPDAVFLPARLISRISMMPRPKNGLFLVNCKSVDHGFFGNLEVFSSMAFSVLVANVDTCSRDLPWKVGIKDGKYGPMGEDLFAEICMEKNGVAKVEAFDITIDGACPGDRPFNRISDKHWRFDCGFTASAAMHPFKKPQDWSACLENTTNAEKLYR